jgi:sulfide:quinone oxidoreductase
LEAEVVRALVLGGGIGGIVAANVLNRKLGRQHEIMLIDRRTEHRFPPSYPWLMMGWREPHKITRNLNLLNKKGIKYVNDEIEKIDPTNRLVKTKSNDFKYDYLIVALGAELAPETIPGFAQGAYHMYELEEAMKTREALKNFSGGTLIVDIASLPFKCPAAPYEAAFFMDYRFRKRGIRNKIEMHFFTAEGRPMGVAPPEIGNKVVEMLESRGITYHPNLKLTTVDSEEKKITFENGESMSFDLLIAIPPHKAPKVVKQSGLADESGWIPVDKNTLKTKFDDVFALGDVNKIMLAMGMPLPKAGVFAHLQAEVVAHNIAADILGYRKKEYNGWGECFLEIGYGKAGLVKGNFYAEPIPDAKMQWPPLSRIWHWSKVIFEKYWFWRWF